MYRYFRRSMELEVVGLLWPLMKGYRWHLGLAVLLGAGAAFFEGIGISLFMPLAHSFDEASAEMDGGRLGRILQQLFLGVPPANRPFVISVAILMIVLMRSAMSYSRGVVASWIEHRIVHVLRCRLLERLFTYEIEELDQNRSGNFLNALEGETWETSVAVTKVVDLIVAGCGMLVLTTLLISISWELAALVALFFVLIAIIVQLLARRVRALSHASVRAWEELYHRMLEIFGGMRTIRAFGREQHEQTRFGIVSKNASRADFHLVLLSNATSPVSEVLIAILIVGILYRSIQAGGDLPTVLTFIFILYRLQPQVRRFDQARTKVIASTAPVQVVMGLLREADHPRAVPPSRLFTTLREGISFRSVSFCYEQHKRVLRDVSLDIPRGRITAFVGPSGAGKSTLVNLLLRFYEPSSGEIAIDGVPLPQLDVVSWRQGLAVVSQDVHLFSASVRDNIAYSWPEATLAEIEEASRLAQAEAFIRSLPEGYETQIGEGGSRLSGGERQRLALARAFLRNAEVLILDEATNALDSLSEREIQEALEYLRNRQTIVIVAHRMSTVERADQVIVMDAGSVCEQGSPRALLEKGGMFARMYRRQYDATHP